MSSLTPKRIKLIINKAQDLQVPPNAKKSKRPSKWRVLFMGVVEKLATAKVESGNGSPEWLCEIIVTCKNSRDPISLLVTDSKGNHAGQVVIALPVVPAKPGDCRSGERPPLLVQNLQRSELEPTKKNPRPQGYLFYWMWIEEYWSIEEVNRLQNKKSLSKSLHNLSSSALNLFRRKSSNQPVPAHHGSISQHPMTLGVQGNPFLELGNSSRDSPFRTPTNKQSKTNSSDTSTSTFNSGANYMLTNNACQTTPNSPVTNGYGGGHHQRMPSNGSAQTPNGNNRNPFDPLLSTAVDISIENSIEQPMPYVPGNANSTPESNPRAVNLSYQTSVGSKDSPSNRKRFGIFNKFNRNKKSQSSADLTNMVQENGGALGNPLGVSGEGQQHQAQSLGKHQGQRLFEKRSESGGWVIGDSEANGGIKSNGITGLHYRPQSCVVDHNVSPFLVNGNSSQNANSNGDNTNGGFQMQHRVSKSTGVNRNFSFNTPSDLLPHFDHANKDEMSKRELVDLAVSLENKLKAALNKVQTLEKELLQSAKDKRNVQGDLTSARDDLCQLKVRLLEAGETKYLEKSDQPS